MAFQKLSCFYYFNTSGRYIPGGFDKKKLQKLTNRHNTQSAQSNAGKQSWSRTALKRCINTGILWKRKHVSLASPELVKILWPKLLRNCRAEELKTPNVSIAIGWKMWRASISIYFSLREAANSAVDPACRAAPSIYDSANGHVTVTSQHSDFPLCQGMSVRPSGLFPSVINIIIIITFTSSFPRNSRKIVIIIG